MFRNYRFRNYNMLLVVFVLALTIIGVFVIGSANEDYQAKQIMGMALGLSGMAVVSLISYEFLIDERWYWVWYVIAIAVLILVLFIGNTVAGATRWIEIEPLGITFQPSELAKVLLVIFFSKFLMIHEEEVNTLRFLAIFTVLAAVPLLLIEKEPDLSTTIVTFMVIVTLLYFSGLTYKIIMPALGIGVPLLILIVYLVAHRRFPLLDSYQSLRILAWLYPDDYPESSYQQQNSIMAIGSGQLYGKGLNNDSFDSVKNGNYISEPQTDFIFAVAGEELGFIGGVIIVALLFAITFACLYTARRARDLAGQLICIGIASIIGFQGFVNICVVTGLMPNTGLPLPFVSYGLTSLVTLYGGIGLVLNVGLQAKKRGY
ncbi:MAG: rod shape-determining protein RodA [Lachnospiraceae bacterium]|nr:rod shape-determining protein RodA [Lachnospiraceae bacterium]